MPAADLQLAALFRREAGSICAWLVRLLGPARLDLIEDAVQDAFSAALVQWPLEGTPQRPAAWLAIAARNKALDRLRRDMRLDSLDTQNEAAAWRLGFSNPDDSGKPDDTLALMFVACHPALAPEEQAMLTLQTVLFGTFGLTKTGSGRLVLGSSGNFTGVTTVSQGELQITSTTSLGTTGAAMILTAMVVFLVAWSTRSAVSAYRRH